ncbi:MAG: DMT family transporter [Sphingobium sp.]
MTSAHSKSGPAGDAPLWHAILLCAGGVALFSVMDGVMKQASLAVSAYSAIFWRGAAATPLAGIAMVATGNRWPPADVMRLHLVRGVILGLMAWLFFWALTRLPLAEAIALSFIAPIIALVLSAVMLGEQVSRYSIAAGLAGIIGVGVILSGRMAGDYDGRAFAGALGVLASAVLFAVNLVLQRRQAQVASAVEVTFFQNAIVLCVLLPFAPWLLKGNGGMDFWAAIIASAFLACGSQLLLASAYARAPASRLIPIEYSAFVWAVLVGWIMFAERLTTEVVAGVVLIVVACFVAAREKPEIAHVETEVV